MKHDSNTGKMSTPVSPYHPNLFNGLTGQDHP